MRSKEWFKKNIKKNQNEFISNLPVESEYFVRKIKAIRRDIFSILRKEEASEAGYKLIKRVGSGLFGLMDYLRYNRLGYYDFKLEKEVLNDFLIGYLEKKISSNYNHNLPSFGESLLCGFIDCLLNASKVEVEKSYGLNPSFLINPDTSQLLEIDLALKEYKIYFEFQGHPSHYQDSTTIFKDSVKLKRCFDNNIVLIPLNISQLNSTLIINTITNTLRDYLGIEELLVGKNLDVNKYDDVSNKQLIRFSKLIHKIFLATKIYHKTLEFLDIRADRYLLNMRAKNPTGFSQNHFAPRYYYSRRDYNINQMYAGVKYISILRKEKKKKLNRQNIIDKT